MIQYVSGNVYFNEDTDIIFNPVGVRDNGCGFISQVKELFPNVYKEYNEMVWDYNERQLLGDIQLVYIGNNRFIMNGFCKYRDGKLNKKALVKTLVELCNLAYEYKLSIGIDRTIGDICKRDRKDVDIILKEIFENEDIDVKVYSKNKK